MARKRKQKRAVDAPTQERKPKAPIEFDLSTPRGRLLAAEAKEAAATKKRQRERARAAAIEEGALADAAVGNKPDVRHVDHLGTAHVQSPYDPARRVHVVTALRDDFLGRLAKRSQIDQAQLTAGRRYQDDCELAEIGGAKSIDTTRTAVDGGRVGDPIDDKHLAAFDRLARYSRVLGMEGEALLRDVLVKRWTLALCARARGLEADPKGPDMRYLGRRFRESLESLARVMGLTGRGPYCEQKPDQLAQNADFADNPRLFEAVRRAQQLSRST